MNGKLTDQPLAELIREIASKELSGALRLEHEQVKTAVYFERGRIVFAATNLRTLRLGVYLKKSGVISEKEFANLKTPGADLSLAASLCASGKLSQKSYDTLLNTLVSDVLRVALLWTEGTWELDERARLDQTAKVTLEPASLLKEAAQRLPLAFVSLRFRNSTETISRKTAGASANDLLPNEGFILSRLDEPLALEELVAVSGLRDLDAYRVIYGLALIGLVEREYWQNAFRTGPAKKDTPKKTPSPTATETAQPVQTDRWAEVKGDDALGEFLERLRAASNFYEVMDVAPKADADEIKEAYYALARRYHPDRFHLKSGTRLHTQISSAFARITQAYETLTDANARSIYNQTLARTQQLAGSHGSKGKTAQHPEDLEFDHKNAAGDQQQAETIFRQGLDLLKQGQVNAAATRLAAVSKSHPQNAKFRAYFGRALAANEQTRRLAENEMQAAVKLEPRSSLYRIMLAELYVELKFLRRAQTELDRAIDINPKNSDAIALLRKLEKLRKVEAKERG